jgi:hypothetical protein
MKKPPPIQIHNLIAELDQLLIEVLTNLTLEEWALPTIAPQWTIKDIAVHLLDGNLRTLSMLRDNYYGEIPPAIHSYQDMVAYLNQLNADWVKATKRLSPRVIIDLLKSSGKEYCDFLKTLNPEDKATFSVAWAGEQESKNWFHIAREYTEKWHHQQQIRLALGKDKKLLKEKWLLPYLDTSVRALPHHYRQVKGYVNDLIKFTFQGKNEKIWFLKYLHNEWVLGTDSEEKVSCEVIIPDKYAWRIFTKGIERQTAIKHSKIIGDKKLGLPIFDMLAVMA